MAVSHVVRGVRRRLWRDRRRFAICAILLAVSGFLSQLHVPAAGGPIWWPLFGAAAFVVGILSCLIVLCIVIPPWRFASEIVCFGVFCLSAVSVTFPGVTAMDLFAGQGPAFWAFILGTTLGAQLWCSTMLDGVLGTVRKPTILVSLRSPLPRGVLWDGLVGTPEYPERLAYAEDVLAFEQIDGGPDRRLKVRLDVGAVEELHRIERLEPPVYAAFRWEAVDPKPRQAFASGHRTFHFVEAGRTCRVEVTTIPDEVPRRGLAMAWVDDGFARHFDTYLATLERRASGPDAPQSNHEPTPA